LMNAPQNLKYSEIETLFQNENFEIEWWKWSHKLITYKKDKNKCITIPIHWNDCKRTYKIKLKEFYKLTK
jgi:predicted RNA binding protein YcfA (HicA-like mRNA interferase family)